MKIVWICLVSVFLCSLLGVYFWYQNSLNSVSTSKQPQTFIVDPGEPANLVIQRLYTQKLIQSKLSGRIYLKLNKFVFRPGVFYLSSSQSLPEIFTELSKGPKDIKVTFPEGWRREQYAARLKFTFPDFDTSQFLKLTATLEGQLFPDTYYFPVNPSPERVVSIISANFAKKSAIKPSQKDLITIASLVERESNNPSDSGLIAGIILKRLENNWPLQIDATVQYSQDTEKCKNSILSCDYWKPIYDTKYPSTYNTYQNIGLPPTPISNPGLISIQSVLSPTASDYWFYLTGNNGQTYFSKTLNEHQKLIDMYLKL